MKKIISLCLAMLLSVTGISCNKKEEKPIPTSKTMVTEMRPDQSFNQTTCEAILEFLKKDNVDVIK